MEPAVIGNYLTGCGLGLSLAGLVVVIIQLRQVRAQLRHAQKQMEEDAAQRVLVRKSASLSALLQLDQVFNSFSAERAWVRRNYGREKPDQEMNLVAYLGAFERLAWAVTGGFLSMENAYGFYGSRLRQLIRTYEARRLLTKANTGGWDNVIRFILALHEWAVNMSRKPIIVTPVRRRAPLAVDEKFHKLLKEEASKRKASQESEEPDDV